MVTEPRPGGGTNYETYYTYNGASQLTNVQLVRDGVTQQRSFQWSGTNLASAPNPENGLGESECPPVSAIFSLFGQSAFSVAYVGSST